ncbi:cellulose biosynthesis protein CelD [Corallococcus sp. H22C18031201]|uniref:GNAT family N-acetyltransferase n=1 Tax=Citreicoccus inhibens TaxID=2849499 RepID=UPI000E71552E|nr:GNAT family N-acetyltransferase [Citreicoccus inhibens]MBU8900595.1 GNAT family N-acetyltransferase [Citreicoccus inhibens]RJS16339.1 cellulose biosynthesis protein CelD [Corallococcus sp. H22C18031201]
MIREDEVRSGPQSAPWLDVAALSNLSELAGMRAAWDELLDASNAGPFSAWEWLYPWCRRIDPDVRPLVLTAKDRTGRLMGLLPLRLEQRWVAGLRVRRLGFLGETHVGSDYLDVVARRGHEAEVARAFFQVLHGLREEWDVLDLTDLREDSATPGVLRELFGPLEVLQRERYICPYETLTPQEPFDAFLKRGSRRDNYLRRRKWLEKQEGYRIERSEEPGQLAGPMTDFFRLHAARWRADGGSQGIKGAGVEAFHRDATQLLAERGRLRLYTMKVGGRAVASVYGLVHAGTFVYFQSGYDPRWHNRSVGLVLVGETFKDSLAAGLTAYDFLRGTEPYKSEWVSQRRRTIAVRVHGAQRVGRWFTRTEGWARRFRDGMKQVLPAEMVERIRRERRRRAAVH